MDRRDDQPVRCSADPDQHVTIFWDLQRDLFGSGFGLDVHHYAGSIGAERRDVNVYLAVVGREVGSFDAMCMVEHDGRTNALGGELLYHPLKGRLGVKRSAVRGQHQARVQYVVGGDGVVGQKAPEKAEQTSHTLRT